MVVVQTATVHMGLEYLLTQPKRMFGGADLYYLDMQSV